MGAGCGQESSGADITLNLCHLYQCSSAFHTREKNKINTGEIKSHYSSLLSGVCVCGGGAKCKMQNAKKKKSLALCKALHGILLLVNAFFFFRLL